MSKFKKQKNCLEAFPDLISSEWHWDYNNVLGINPDNVSCASSTVVFWHCGRCGSIYRMSPKKRMENKERKKTSCFSCRGIVQRRTFTV